MKSEEISKISIYVVDDNESHRNSAIEALCPNPTGDSNELIEFSYSNFEITQFVKPITGAKKELEEKRKFPDLAIIDIDFSGLDADPDIGELDKSKTAGKDLIIYIKSQKKAETIIFYVTGQANDEEVEEALEKLELEHGFDARTRAFKPWVEKSDKGSFLSLRKKIPNALKQISLKYFLQLSMKDREILKDLISKIPDDAILDLPFKFGNKVFLLKNLLVGFWDVQEKKIINPRETIKNLISQSELEEQKFQYPLPEKIEERLNNFSKEWKVNNLYLRTLLAKHVTSGDHQKKVEIFDCLGIDYLVKVKTDNRNDASDMAYFRRFTGFYTEINNFDLRNFETRLIVRKILLGWAKLHIANYSTNFDDIYDYIYPNGSQDHTQKQIRMKLGLRKSKTPGSTLRYDLPYILPEEEDWIGRQLLQVFSIIEKLLELNKKLETVFPNFFQPTYSIISTISFVNINLDKVSSSRKQELDEVLELINQFGTFNKIQRFISKGLLNT